MTHINLKSFSVLGLPWRSNALAMAHINRKSFGVLELPWRMTETFISMPPTVNKFETFSYLHNDKQESCPAREPSPLAEQWGKHLIAHHPCWLFLLISLILPGPTLPLPSMALAQFAFHSQGLISQNVTELTYKRETVLEIFVISPQHTETYISTAQRPGAARGFI